MTCRWLLFLTSLAAGCAASGKHEGEGEGEGEGGGGGGGEGEGESCEPLTIDLVTYENNFHLFIADCGCSELFPQEIGVCGQTSGGDESACECISRNATAGPPALGAVTMQSADGETAFDFSQLGEDAMVRLPREPHGPGPLTFRVGGCWGDDMISGVGASGAPAPVCNTSVSPVECTQAPNSDHSLACTDADVLGSSCCSHDAATFVVEPYQSPDEYHTQSAQAVYSEGTHTLGTLTVRLWRVGVVNVTP